MSLKMENNFSIQQLVGMERIKLLTIWLATHTSYQAAAFSYDKQNHDVRQFGLTSGSDVQGEN